MPCEKCPCPNICLGWDSFCVWAKEYPPNPINLKHICGRSQMGAVIGPSTPPVRTDGGSQVVPSHPVPASYPSLATQGVNLIKAGARFVASGFKFASKAEQERRRSICAVCPHWDDGPKRCRLCGCKTEAKIMSASESCPDKPPRWESEY